MYGLSMNPEPGWNLIAHDAICLGNLTTSRAKSKEPEGLVIRVARLPLRLPQHPDEHRSKRPILLAVDQKLGEGAALRVAPELTDPRSALEVGEHENVEQLGAGGGTEGFKA